MWSRAYSTEACARAVVRRKVDRAFPGEDAFEELFGNVALTPLAKLKLGPRKLRRFRQKLREQKTRRERILRRVRRLSDVPSFRGELCAKFRDTLVEEALRNCAKHFRKVTRVKRQSVNLILRQMWREVDRVGKETDRARIKVARLEEKLTKLDAMQVRDAFVTYEMLGFTFCKVAFAVPRVLPFDDDAIRNAVANFKEDVIHVPPMQCGSCGIQGKEHFDFARQPCGAQVLLCTSCLQ